MWFLIWFRGSCSICVTHFGNLLFPFCLLFLGIPWNLPSSTKWKMNLPAQLSESVLIKCSNINAIEALAYIIWNYSQKLGLKDFIWTWHTISYHLQLCLIFKSVIFIRWTFGKWWWVDTIKKRVDLSVWNVLNVNDKNSWFKSMY